MKREENPRVQTLFGLRRVLVVEGSNPFGPRNAVLPKNLCCTRAKKITEEFLETSPCLDSATKTTQTSCGSPTEEKENPLIAQAQMKKRSGTLHGEKDGEKHDSMSTREKKTLSSCQTTCCGELQASEESGNQNSASGSRLHP